ncbi:YbgF trimerization domain-containing protein [Marinimicrobium alkaliphilum]|uniref:YbgF trimerization domain-containing protein n=1 Tax=Marinimicrobium alkaliphilum TaxID=2202654 RepID=UPI000DBA8C12|nr:YbgF trimerization domain-containing protein [Marinimicrobium alkaliphilum]
MVKYLLAAAVLAAAPVLQAQVEVRESTPQGVRASSGAQSGQPQSGQGSGAGEASSMLSELYFQLQTLQQEVLELRGQVEEQAHEIQRLKQQRMDDYMDLDRRLSELSGGGALPGGSVGAGRAGGGSLDSDAEAEVYRAAYDRLRQRDLDGAAEAFKSHLERFPDGDFTGNSYYWLGEIYLLKDELGDARDWFSRLLEDFPDDRKVPDAKYKLARVYHLQGDDNQARRLMQEVADSGSDAARLAQQYLQENF